MAIGTNRLSGSGLLATLPLAAVGMATLVTPASAQTDAAAYGTRAPVQCGPFRSFDGTPAAAARIWQCASERAGDAGQGTWKDEPPPGPADGTIGPMAALQSATDPPVTDPPVTGPPAATPPVTTAPTGGRRVARDPNRPIGPNDTVIYEDPLMPGQPQRCTVLEVFVGAYRIQCLNRPGRAQFIARDLDVRRPDGTAPQQSAATAPTGPPFRPGDIILASPMGLQDEQYWRLCVVISNQVRETNSYTVNCGDSRYNVLPDWVRADPEFQ